MAGKAIIVKVQGEGDFKDLQARIDRVFGVARQRAEEAADGIERSLGASGEGAVRAARRASEAFAGVSRTVARELRSVSDGADFGELTARANEAFRRIDPSLLAARLAALPLEVRPGALRDAYNIALAGVSTAPLSAKLRNLVSSVDAALAGRELGDGIQRGLGSVDIQGMIDFLEAGVRRVDASPLTREFESALGAVDTGPLVVGVDAATQRIDFDSINQRLRATFESAPFNVFSQRANAALSALDFSGITRNLREAFSSLGVSGVGDSLSSAVRAVDFSPLGDMARQVRVEVLDALDFGAINTNLGAVFGQGLDASPVRDRIGRMQDEIRGSVERLPPFLRGVGGDAGRALGDGLEGALADLPDRFDRTNQRLAAEVRKLADTLPREAVPAAAELANALDPRPFTARKFDGLQDQLARVARDLPDEFKPAALKIADVLEDSARKIPPPFALAADRAGESLDDIPRAARQAAEQADDAFRRAADDIPRHFDGVAGRISSKFDGVRRGLANIFQITVGNLAADAIGNLTSGVTQFVSDAPTKAIDLQASRISSQQVFGAASTGVEEFARNSAAAIGLSERAALNATTAFGNQFVQLGIGADEAARMAQIQTSLIGDFATFKKISPERATEALSAAYRGEYDSLQQVIPAITAKKIEDQALADTGKRSAKQLTDQEKALAAYQVILGNVGPAQGAFRNGLELGNPAAQMLLYNAQLEDTQTRLGTKMIPLQLQFKQAQLAVATFMVDRALPVLSRYSGILKDKFGPALGEAKDKAGEFVTGLSQGFVAGDVSGFQNAGVQIRSFFESAFTGKTQNEDPTGIEQVGLGLRRFVLFLVEYAPKVGQFIGDMFDKIGDVLGSDTVQEAWAGLSDAWSELVETLTSEDAKALFAGIGDAISAFFGSDKLGEGGGSAFAEFIAGIIGWLRLFLAVVTAVLKYAIGFWEEHGDTVIAFAGVMGNAVGRILELVGDMLRVINDLVDFVTAVVNGDWAAAWEAAKSLLGDALGWITDLVLLLPLTILDAARTMWAPLYNELVPVVNRIIRVINDMIGGLNIFPGVDIDRISSVARAPEGKGKPVVRPLKILPAATGDVAYRQQIRLIGDNYRAASDPEIVSPQSAIARAVAMALEDVEFGSQGPQRVINIDKVVTPPGRDLWQEIGLMERVLAQV
jgi:hypothetical protein